MGSTETDGTTRDLILVVDDDHLICDIVASWLEQEGYSIETYTSGEDCLAALSSLMPSAVCLDLHLPGLSGLETLDRIQKTHPHLPVMFLTGETDVSTAVSAIKLGAFDYLAKPVDRARLMTQVRNAVERGRMALELAQLHREIEGTSYPGLIGSSPGMRNLQRQMDRLAACDTTVLIHGESGSGKELVARGIHSFSGRRDGSFVALNCAAIPESLQEAELFGHEKGAFTDATEQRQGSFEEADGGTLFLDEVGELNAGLQAKLLRAIQERSFRRIGGRRDIESDFRLLAATNRNLDEAVKAGRFRQDLFFRLAVYELEVPPLSRRVEDIVVLARFFVGKHGADRDPVPELHPDVEKSFENHSWPGNVRELENAIQHALVVAEDQVMLQHLPRRLRQAMEQGNGASALTDDQVVSAEGSAAGRLGGLPSLNLEDLERLAMTAALESTSGNLAKAGRLLGVSRSTVYRKLRRYGLIDEDQAETG